MYDWLIVGGGPLGCVIAGALIRIAGVDPSGLAVLDEHPQPLARWHQVTAACGMRYLRSPAAHSIEPDYAGLLRFAARHDYELEIHTIPAYARPSLELFNHHARETIRGMAIPDRWISARAIAIARHAGSWTVRTDSGGSIAARRVVLSLGQGAGLNRPGWSRDLPARSCAHVFETSFALQNCSEKDRVAVVGGGISAGQVATALSAGLREVVLLSRHPLRAEQFDSDPCYIGPRCMEQFIAISGRDLRRKALQDAQNPGTMTPDVYSEVIGRIAAGRLELRLDEVIEARSCTGTAADPAAGSPAGEMRLVLASGESVRCDRVILATGYARDAAARRLTELAPDLPTDREGAPLLAETLEWAPGLYVTGKAAAVELGPSAGNLVGGHNAAKRIVSTLSGRPELVPRAWRHYASINSSSSSSSSSRRSY